jgi:hypothetical protein
VCVCERERERQNTNPRQHLSALLVNEGINLLIVLLLGPFPPVPKGCGNRCALHRRGFGVLPLQRGGLAANPSMDLLLAANPSMDLLLAANPSMFTETAPAMGCKRREQGFRFLTQNFQVEARG